MFLNKTIHIKVLLLLLCLALGNGASAQFWKRGGGKRKKAAALNIDSVASEPVANSKKKRAIEYPQSIAKERYRIDVLLPLYLDELVKEDKPTFKSKVPEKAQAGISFYEGLSIAVDSLTHMGYKTDIFVHDLTSKGATIEELLQKDSLEHTDLIIGYVSAPQLPLLAKFAASKKINFISAFSPSDANIKDNPYFVLMNPTLQNNCEAIVQSVVKKKGQESVFIFKRESLSVDSLAYHFMVEEKELSHAIEVDCNKMPDSTKLSLLLDSMNTNLLVMPILDANYCEKIIQKLHRCFPKYHFEIYGMPSWKGMCSNKKMMELGENVAITITQPYNFDANSALAQSIAEKHKIKFGGKANDITYRGFELVFWMTDLLNKYGAVFNEKTEDKSMALFTKYDLKPKWDKDNNFYYTENKHLYLYRYQAGKVLVSQ
jgi:hypothetical protein